MAFRRSLFMLAVLALMVSAASAQVGTATGSPGAALACVATAAGTPQLRPESYTDLIGDILITCTGGLPVQVGTAIPTVNISVTVGNGVPITSRLLDSNSGSEALLIIDDAGSALPTGAVGPYGPNALQTLCTSAQQQAVAGSQVGCPQYVGKDTSGNYLVGVSTSTSGNGTGTASANVYQGKVGAPYGASTVTFYAVPVLPPATGGVTRTFRVTNVRVPSANFGQTLGAPISATISASPSTVLPLSVTSLTVGVAGPAVTAAVSAVSTAFQQCKPTTLPTLTSTLIFTEGFATAFKTRVVPGGIYNGQLAPAVNPNVAWNGEAQNFTGTTSIQNIPGGLYGGFAQNSESGLIFPLLSGATSGSSGVTFVAGLADYGTRLKAVFTNIPAGLTLYVSTTSTGTAPSPAGGTSVLPWAVLVAGNSGEATSDGSTFSSSVLLSTGTAGSDGFTAYPLVSTSTTPASATAVWEVVNANPSAQDVMKFSVYIQYSPQAANGISGDPKQYGLPITDLPTTAALNNVDLSMAPTPGGGALFSPTALQGFGTTYFIPRFTSSPVFSGRWTKIVLCQTTLLYPYVLEAQGFDTGIAIANTTVDPFTSPKTLAQSGSCTLYGYGVTLGATGIASAPITFVLPGCDAATASTAAPNVTCFPVVAPGTVGAMSLLTFAPGFQGYVIALCNFQLAHGYAAITDIGSRSQFASYLALELAPSLNAAGATRGISSEILAH